MSLRVSTTLSLPVDSATGTFGILATKGSGKSNAAVVMAEEMYDAGVPWVAVDPKGDWYGVRSSGDGRGPGLPIVVFGGRHGDVPLEPGAGPMLAELIVNELLTCVLDVSEFTKAETIRFLHDFGARLFRAAESDPLHLFLEEAHEYLPQRVESAQANMVGTWQRIVKQGRFKGLGCTLVSQRSASLNKDVLELVDTLIVLRTMGPRSREAIAAWVKDQDVDSKLMASLPTLKDGEAWVWSPGELKIMERIQFRRRRTFDSGATPKVGEKRRTPSTLADVDLAKIKDAMAETIERAKAEDPKELHKQITALRRELAARPTVEAQVVEKVVEVPVVPTEVADALGALRGELYSLAGRVERAIDLSTTANAAARESRANAREVARPAPARTPVTRADPVTRPAARDISRERAETEGDLSPYATVLLAALAERHPIPLTTRQWSVASDRSTTSSGWDPAVRQLRTTNCVQQRRDGDWEITEKGLAVAGVDPGLPPPSGAELIDWWCLRIPGPEQKALRVLASEPEPITQHELADLAGWSRTSSGPGAAVGTLVKLGLVERHGGLIYLDDTLR